MELRNYAYPRIEGVIDANHTFVDPSSLSGQGVARQLGQVSRLLQEMKT